MKRIHLTPWAKVVAVVGAVVFAWIAYIVIFG
jgi:hypothetical protein